QDRFGLGSLQGQKRGFVRKNVDFQVFSGRKTGQMLHVGLTSPRVDDPEEAVVGFFIDDDVIDDPALVIEEKTVKSAADGGFGQVVSESVIGKFVGLRARDAKTAHVADVEKP